MAFPNVPTTGTNDIQHRRQIALATNWILDTGLSDESINKKAFPIGSLFLTLSSEDDPGELLKIGTWTLIGRLTAEPA